MFSALLYLQAQQTRNRLRARLRRLRQPKYIFGALVGGLYLYFNFFRFFLWRNHAGQPVASSGAAMATALGVSAAALSTILENAGALLWLVRALLGWILPSARAALVFTEAEVAFLFPAPIPRRTLVQFRLLRSQFGILFSIILLTIITGRFFGATGWLGVVQPIAGWWIILSTLSLQTLAISFARSLLLERGVSNWRRRVFTLVAVALLAGGTLVWTQQTLANFSFPASLGSAVTDNDPRKAFFALLQSVNTLLDAPPLRWVLWPFKLPLRPLLAPDAAAFFLALGPALALLGLLYALVLRADVAFEESSLEASRQHAARIENARSRGQGRAQPYKRRRDPFPLRPGGARAVALLWKNLLAAGGLFSLRTLLTAAGIFVVAFVSLRTTTTGHGGPGGNVVFIVGLLAVEFLFLTVLFGSQMVRNDLRLDFANADLLKTYPLPGWQIVLGELLAPALLLTLLQWALLGVVLACLAGGFEGGINGHFRGPQFTARLPLALAAAGVLPAFNVLSLAVPNAAVLFLPGWFQRGPQAPQGVEVMGQRLIFFFGQFFVLVVALAPAVIVGGGVYFAGRLLGGSETLIVLLAALATTLVLVGEIILALFPLGRWFENLDLAAEGKN